MPTTTYPGILHALPHVRIRQTDFEDRQLKFTHEFHVAGTDFNTANLPLFSLQTRWKSFLEYLDVLCETLPATTGDFAIDVYRYNAETSAPVSLFSTVPLIARRIGSAALSGEAAFGGLRFLKTVDNGVNYTDYTSQVTDAGAGVATLSSLDTLANGDYVLVGADDRFEGVFADMAANVNTNAATLAVHYRDGSAWQAVSSLSDGTAAAGATLAQDGEITWILPHDWVKSTINNYSKFWVRLSVSAALSAAVEVTEARIIRPRRYALRVAFDQNRTVVSGGRILGYVSNTDATLADVTLILHASLSAQPGSDS